MAEKNMRPLVRRWLTRMSAALALAGAITLMPTAQAALVTATYTMTASGFANSSFEAPTAPTSSLVSGSFTFSFDTAPFESTGLAVSAVAGFDITRNDGLVIDFDTSNTLARVRNLTGPTRLVTFGGAVSTEARMVGLTEPGDFRLVFEFDDTSAAVVDVREFLFLTRFDPVFGASSVQVQLTAVPCPPLLPASVLTLILLGVARGRRTRETGAAQRD